jgi:flagellar biosynthesis component FlhA
MGVKSSITIPIPPHLLSLSLSLSLSFQVYVRLWCLWEQSTDKNSLNFKLNEYYLFNGQDLK